MSELSSLRVRARLDRDSAAPGSHGSPFLLVEFGVDHGGRKRTGLRRPLELALAVDASSSMEGDALDSARRIVRTLVERLAPCDRLTLVSFAGDIRPHLERLPMDPVGRTIAIHGSREIVSRRGTNISKGWFEASLRLLRGASANDGTARRVIVVSDGGADRGILEPGELAAMASEFRATGLLTSAIRLGSGCRTVYLTAISDAGGGALHAADREGRLEEPSLAELLDHRGPAARDVRLELSAPGEIAVENVGRIHETVEDGRTSYPIGPLVPGSRRAALFRFHVEKGSEGRKFRIRAGIRYRTPRTREERSAVSNWVFLGVRPAPGEPPRIPDTVLGHRIAAYWREGLIRRLIAADAGSGRDGDPPPLEEALREFRSYCSCISETGAIVEDVESAVAACRLGLPEALSAGSGRGDTRRIRRAAWNACFSRMKQADDVRP